MRAVNFCCGYICSLLFLATAFAQVAAQAPVAQQGFGNQNVNFGLGPGGMVGAGTNTTGGAGGAASADFDSLIDLITSTVQTETWAETGGGEAEIRPFPTGVMVDAAGTLKLVKATAPSRELAARRAAPPPKTTAKGADPRTPSELRFVSLPRLEREIVRRQDAGEPLDLDMLALAGLRRVEYIFIYPETNDLVLAGPAGDWRVASFGRIVAAVTGEPIVRLDDLLTLLRRDQATSQRYFGCMINPRQEALAATQAYLDRTGARPLEPSRREAWLEKIRTTLGQQDVELFGIDPTSRVARVLVEADVHMKLIGMGLEDGVPGVESYLDSAADLRRAGGAPAAMSVLRWWFALHYAAINASPAGDAYQLIGPGVRVLSENEALAAQGQRIHTGQSDPLNREFADSFTANFALLAEKYPIYGELRNIFDLALAVALIKQEKLTDRAGWQPSRFLENEKLRLPEWPAPREVDTVANCVVANRRTIIAGVSGGVIVAPADVLANRASETSTKLTASRNSATPAKKAAANEPITWWWDAPSAR